MRFDNRQFEDGVQTSLSSLDRLRRSLNLEGAARGLEAIDDAAGKCKMTPLGDAVDSVKMKFSAMQIVAVTALTNITNSVINTGKQMIKSLTVDPISDGFKEYELKMDSVQNIMNGSGESLETVMGYLEELNTYADRTIYSFSDMTSNIGKFTNSGVKLKDAVKAIQGVSNVAAISGSNTQQASHAMYNFAQALSSGSVKLIDWKSIENANMATVEFKEELLKTAVALGTVKKKGDKYVSTTKNAQGKVSGLFNATENFNESLSNQWMTTDVLVQTLGRYSDETTDIGKKAFAAAQDVKTFSQLMDTLKEAVGSGWSETWELIFGNYNEAKQLWTEVSNAVGGVIDRMSKSRNALLKEWKDLDGRTALIDAFRNAIKGLLSFVKPAKDAFQEIFPAVTGKQLAALTKNLRDFTEKFKIGGKAAERLKSTFKGFFAIFDVAGQIFSALLSGVKELLPFLPKLGGGFLTVTGGIGDFLVTIDAFLKRNKVFKKAVDGVVKTLKAIPGVIDSLFRTITGVSVGDVLGMVGKRFSEAFDVFKEVLDGFKGLDTSGLDSVGNKIAVRFAPLTAIFNGAKRLFQAVAAAFGKLAPIFATLAARFGEALGHLGDALNDAITHTDFNGLLDIFNSGILISIGLGLRNLIDTLTDTSEHADGIVDGIKEVINGATDCLSTMQQNLKADILQKIAIAIGILTASLVVLSLIDSDRLTNALAALVGEFITLFGAISIFEKTMGSEGFTGLQKAARVMITISAAILILSFAMKNLASLDWGGVAKGLVGISGLAAVLLVVSRVMSQNTGKLVQAAAGMVIFAVALRMLVKPVQTFGAMKKKELENGLGSVAAILSGFVAFTRYVGSPEKILSVAAAMVIFTVALRMMVKPVEQFAAMDEASLAKGILSVGTILAGIVGFTRYVGSPDKILSVATGMVLIGAAMLIFGKAVEQIGNLSYEQLAKGMLTIAVSLIMIVGAVNALPATTPLAAVGLVLIAAALNLLALALTKLGKMSWGGVVKSLVALAGSLTIIAVAVTLMMAALPGAAALVVVAGALAILAPVLKLFGSMSMAEIGKSLLMLAASFGVIGVAGLLLAPIVPVLLALGAAILLLGTGVLACGAGILALSAGITALAVAGTAGIAALVLAIEAFLSLLPQIAIKIGEGFVAMMMAIGNAADGLCIALTQILLAIIQALAALIEPLVDVILQFVTVLLEKLAEYTPRMVKAGIDLIVGLIEGLAQGIEQNADRIKAALESLLRSLITLALTVLGIHSPSTVFKNIAVNIVLGLIQGLTEKAGELKTKAESVISGAVNKVRSKIKDFKQAGIDMMNGLKQGVEQCKATVIATATNIGSGAVNAIKKLLGIHSPSRVFASIGEMMDRGWIQGIQTFGDDVSEAAEGVGQTALSGMAGVIAHISDSLDNDLDMQPTIRPVLDLSDIQNGVKRFRKLMPESNAYGIGASFGLANRVLQSMKERQQNIGSDRHYGDINLYANFTNANQRDGMALLGMLNRELGGALL